MPDIFISYNRHDRHVARWVADALVARGQDVWWDAALDSGDDFDSVVERALKSAKVVVVLWSKTSVASRWVRSEATLADRLGTLVPATIEPCERPIAFELVQTADLTAWKGNVADPTWRAFEREVLRRLAEGPEPAPPASATSRVFKLPDKPSIAVLPFTDMATGPDHSYFADGVVEEISTELARFQTLFVIAAASSLTYREDTPDPAKVCRELGVRYLLQGSVRQMGAKVRINVKLIDGIEGEQVWADRFDGDFDDIFDLQERVARAVAAMIDSTIDTAELRRAAVRPTHSADANELYWQANAKFRNFDRASLHEAIALCEKVMELEPKNVWAASLAGFCHASCLSYGWTDDRAASHGAALAFYDKAMRGGGDDPRVLGYCGALLTTLGVDPQMADRLADRTLELSPGSATSLFWGGWNALISGRPELGLERFEMALRLNPRSVVRPLTLTGMGTCHLVQGRFDDAATTLREAVQQLPHFPPALACLTAALAHGDRVDEARDVYGRLASITGGSPGPMLLRQPDHLALVSGGLAIAARVEPAEAR